MTSYPPTSGGPVATPYLPPPSSGGQSPRPADLRPSASSRPASGAPLVVPAPALPAWPPPTNPLSSAGSASAGTPGYSLPTADPGPGVAADARRTPTSSPTPLAPADGPTTPQSPGYRDWARDQRPEGTVYGGAEGHVTISMPADQQVENSGSLTGHILAQGWTDGPSQKTNTTKVVLMLLVGIGILVAAGLLLVLFIGDSFSNLTDGLLSG